LVDRLEQRKQDFEDTVIPGAMLNFTNPIEGVCLNLDLPNGTTYELSNLAHRQVAKASGIPEAVFSRMIVESKGTCIETLHNMLRAKNGHRGFVVRSTPKTGVVKSVMMGTQAMPVHHVDVARWLQDWLLSKVGVDLESSALVDYYNIDGDGNLGLEISLRGFDQKLSPEPNDIIRTGFAITNSDLTNTPKNFPQAIARLVYLACTNGMTSSELVGATGMSREKRALGSDDETLRRGFTSDLDISRGISNLIPDRVKMAKGIHVPNAQKVVTALFAEFRVDKDLEGIVLERFQGNGDVTNMTKWDFINRWTAAAKRCETDDGRVFLEDVGGRLLNIPIESLDIQATTAIHTRSQFRRLQFQE